jgi:hypothetical protein
MAPRFFKKISPVLKAALKDGMRIDKNSVN